MLAPLRNKAILCPSQVEMMPVVNMPVRSRLGFLHRILPIIFAYLVGQGRSPGSLAHHLQNLDPRVVVGAAPLRRPLAEPVLVDRFDNAPPGPQRSPIASRRAEGCPGFLAASPRD